MNLNKNSLEIEEVIIEGDGCQVPVLKLTPLESRGAVVVAHNYGGSKEEMLGLAFRIAKTGFTTGVIDLRGHGENRCKLDGQVLSDLKTAINYFKQFGNVTAVGHSLGGRLSLISGADHAIGISPALAKTFGPKTQGMIRVLRDYRVNGSVTDLFTTLAEIPQMEFDPEDVMIICGSRDVPEIIDECAKLASKGYEIVEIDNALHVDIYTLEPTFEAVTKKLQKWY
ncbi:MAG: alpha/beta hydrolase [Methanobacterium sp. ERen5]|nr:MAG: alpha/beta hydrolase [Methanobacterium sp. ERen5]